MTSYRNYRNELQQRAHSAASQFLRSHRRDATVFERDVHVLAVAKQHGYDDADQHWFWEVFTDYVAAHR